MLQHSLNALTAVAMQFLTRFVEIVVTIMVKKLSARKKHKILSLLADNMSAFLVIIMIIEG